MTRPLNPDLFASRLAALPPDRVSTAQDRHALFGITDAITPQDARDDAPEPGARAAHAPRESFASRLATLPSDRVLTTEDIEWLFGIQDNGVTRMVKRGDLPPPAPLCGRNIWSGDCRMMPRQKVPQRLSRWGIEVHRARRIKRSLKDQSHARNSLYRKPCFAYLRQNAW